ncbi:hypothetical protein [Streptomyces sp. MBT53]|uniref:hypothetical protein n=1 Tax=Streptomyces sp. MBT53 TaxID=1488384 RepID=UPI001912CA2D|nr:hypothetical protein [Streptomyces sp. MBT53]MBK6011724.1 hypothetical protein [Streptomyces sp. MBT53]
MDRIAPGHHLYAGLDGSWRHSTPDGRFTRIRGPRELLTAAQRLAYGADDEPVDPALESEHGQALLAALSERGTLTTAPKRPAPGTLSVHIEGDNPLAHAAAALLPSGTRIAGGPVDEDAVRAADAVICCAGWLPDAHWQRVDAWCALNSTAWHRCHAEGLRFVLGPMSVPGRTVSYADTRGRLLAAADLPDELATHWAYLDGDTVPPVPWPGAAATAVLAGLLVEDVLRWHETGTPAAQDVQLVVDAATAGVERHRVLPLPLTTPAGAVR